MLKRNLYYIIKRLSERERREHFYLYNKSYIEIFDQEKNRKPISIIRKEVKALKKYWKTFPYQYYRHCMYRDSCTLSIEQMKSYIPDYVAYYLLFPRSFKERNCLFEDKKLFAATCLGYEIPQPHMLFITENNCYQTLSGRLKTTEEVLCDILKSESKKLFFKPTYGVGGKGIEIFEKAKNTYINIETREPLSENYLEAIKKDNYIIQEGLVQHPCMNQIYSGSVNTFRVITKFVNNKAEVLFSILRIGRYGRSVDNASSGGIYIKVDSQTGELNRSAMSHHNEEFSTHPDTGFVFDGHIIPYWNDITATALNAAQCFKEVKYIGWDIAYTDNGAVIIEGNNGPDISLIQDCYGGAKDFFDIQHPDELWYSSKYSLKDL